MELTKVYEILEQRNKQLQELSVEWNSRIDNLRNDTRVEMIRMHDEIKKDILSTETRLLGAIQELKDEVRGNSHWRIASIAGMTTILSIVSFLVGIVALLGSVPK